MAHDKEHPRRPSVAGRPIAGLDHAIVGVRDLNEAAAIYRKLGLRSRTELAVRMSGAVERRDTP